MSKIAPMKLTDTGFVEDTDEPTYGFFVGAGPERSTSNARRTLSVWDGDHRVNFIVGPKACKHLAWVLLNQ